MKNKPTYEELARENEDLKEILSKVIKAYKILNNELKDYQAKNDGFLRSTVTSVDEVRKLLDKYSRL